MEGPLDFELEDPLVDPPVTKKRKKTIGMDDLLAGFYKEQSKLIEKESKKAKTPIIYDSDDDEDEDSKEALVSKAVDDCHRQVTQLNCEEDNSMWGIRVFGDQKPPQRITSRKSVSCSFLKSFMKNELNTLVQLTTETGENFLETLLLNGWLSILVVECRHVEKSIALWTFNLILYSPREELSAAACDFWCTILSSIMQDNLKPIEIGWYPSYADLRRALDSYGFLFNFSSKESVDKNSSCGKPPQNISAWVQILSSCSRARSKKRIFKTSEAEELVQVIICLFLDRQLMGLWLILYECMQSVISYFTDEEWPNSCVKIGKSLVFRVPIDMNCLRAVECISGVGDRDGHLRSTVAYQMLFSCLDNKGTNEVEILSWLISINLKARDCDLFMVYIYLVLTENWLLSTPLLKEKPVLCEMWNVYLRNCSCHISSTDMRPNAPKVRNKASYLLQGIARD